MAGRGGGAIFSLELAAVVAEVVVVVMVVVLSLHAVRRKPAWPPPRLACSTIPWREAEMAFVAALAAVLRGEAGLRGEGGRAR